MSSKHTPGPWRALENPHTASPAHDYWHILAGDGFLGDEGCGLEIAGFMSAADARLIAAAPDLLRACKESLKWIGHGAPHPGIGHQIAAAIAKAEGDA